MCTVLEDVGQRHGARTESMHEYRLEFALDKMENHDSHGELLEIGWRGDLGRAQGRQRIDVGSEGVDSRVDKDRAQVLDNEDGTPCDLRTEVFHSDGCASRDSDARECG